MKAIKKIISTVVVLCLCISMSAITAFADRGKYEKLGYLTADEVFERTWDCILTSRGTEHEQKSGDTTELSYEYSKYSDFMKNFDIKNNNPTGPLGVKPIHWLFTFSGGLSFLF